MIPFSDEGNPAQGTDISSRDVEREAIRRVSRMTPETTFNWCGDQIEEGIAEGLGTIGTQTTRHCRPVVVSSTPRT